MAFKMKKERHNVFIQNDLQSQIYETIKIGSKPERINTEHISLRENVSAHKY